MSGSKGNKPKSAAGEIICRNRRARHEYEILDEIDCGIALLGSEVKSIRNHKVSIDEAFARVENGEVSLYNCDIATYPQATYMNHEPRRPRKLLLKRREIARFAEAAAQKGLTLIPLSMHFSERGHVKVTLAVGKGRKLHDKRENLKKEQTRKEMRAAMTRRA